MVKQTKKGPTLEPFARIGQHGRYHGRLGPVRVLGSGLAVLAALLVACGRDGGSTVVQGASAGATRNSQDLWIKFLFDHAAAS